MSGKQDGTTGTDFELVLDRNSSHKINQKSLSVL